MTIIELLPAVWFLFAFLLLSIPLVYRYWSKEDIWKLEYSMYALFVVLMMSLFHPLERQVEIIQKENFTILELPYETDGLTKSISEIVNLPKELKWHEFFVKDVSLYTGDLGNSYWNISIDRVDYGSFPIHGTKKLGHLPTNSPTITYSLTLFPKQSGSVKVNMRFTAKLNPVYSLLIIFIASSGFWSFIFLARKVWKRGEQYG